MDCGGGGHLNLGACPGVQIDLMRGQWAALGDRPRQVTRVGTGRDRRIPVKFEARALARASCKIFEPGWGRRIRTPTNGSRARRPTVRRSPNDDLIIHEPRGAEALPFSGPPPAARRRRRPRFDPATSPGTPRRPRGRSHRAALAERRATGVWRSDHRRRLCGTARPSPRR